MLKSSLPRCGVLIALLLIAACRGDGLGTPGPTNGSCTDLHDAASCAANSACEVETCPGCGEPSFVGCFDKGQPHQVACVRPYCPASPCTFHETAADCEADSACEPVGCPDCNGGQTFQGCSPKGGGPDLVCAAVCPDCSTHQDESSCAADSSCHPLFIDPGTCDCSSPGCCMQFNRCANGPARCEPENTGSGTCPPSGEVLCGGDYVTSYAGACAEGCVRTSECGDCRLTGCTGGKVCQACWSSYACIPEGSAC